ncbi:hypothetical protein RE432_14845 [Pusillimonas sp. SM2304]|uniref:phage adaptor protein n=1 Tax=Pusillimonas sp. SM2304 TaxID=3073241 RepID=UPI00287532E8|nr:hypothetical protein [Pusillimonas sp. SM2304]MDS1141717.1 hypothetical protein [Pusillimonas sp. SM2304]
MAQVADFQRYVLPFIANAPLPAVDDAVVDACVDFCTRTRVLRTIMAPVALVPGPGEYELDAPDGDNVIVSVTSCWLPQGKVFSKTRRELDDQFPNGWANLETSDTRSVWGFHCRLPGFLRLVPKLSVKVSRAMTLEVAYAPSRTATEVDDVLFQLYAEVIAAGALSRLHKHPDAIYADPSRVAAYTEEFEQAIASCGDDSAHGFAYQPMRTGRDEFQ